MKTLGLDIGTTSISAVVWSDQAGVLASESMPNGTFLPSPRWERLQDPDAIWEKADGLVKALLQRHPDVQALGVTGQMHGIVYLDGGGRCVSPLYTWQDGRGDLPFAEGVSWAQQLSRLTGYPLSTGFGLVTHFYNLRQGLVPETARVLCTIADYAAMKLSGRTTPVIDPTNAASLGGFDLRRSCFDEAALAKAGINPSMLGTVGGGSCLGVGCLGIPVYAAIGDNQAAFLGAAGGRTDVLLANVGTGSQIAVYSPEYLTVEGLETRPFPGGGWLLVGASLCGGRSYALLENFFRQTVKMVTGSDESVYDAMTRALDAAGTLDNCPHAVTTFQGTRRDPSLRGSITGIGIDNFTPVHFMHSIMDAMAQELYDLYRGYLEKGGKAPEMLIGSGNGLRKNPHLCRTFARVFGCPLTLSPCEEEAACGAALLAAKHEASRRS
ncbi:MAG: FGGY family carbohydrate kinase [Firmicutes bacterium]|nr:FGGY family carbohydrate kinase [Bacillota bacterium]